MFIYIQNSNSVLNVEPDTIMSLCITETEALAGYDIIMRCTGEELGLAIASYKYKSSAEQALKQLMTAISKRYSEFIFPDETKMSKNKKPASISDMAYCIERIGMLEARIDRRYKENRSRIDTIETDTVKENERSKPVSFGLIWSVMTYILAIIMISTHTGQWPVTAEEILEFTTYEIVGTLMIFVQWIIKNLDKTDGC